MSTATVFRVWAAFIAGLLPGVVSAGVATFFDSNQVVTLVATGATSDTISSEGYLFTYTRDKLFTGGVGLTNPIGRSVRIPWPDGLEAQYVTSGPQPGKATITIRRVDGAVFDLTSFTAKLLANAGAGRAVEIVPLLNGEEPLNDPLYFDVSGNYGNEFSYDTTPNYLGSTAALTNYDTYKVTLTLDFALTALTLQSAAPDPNHAPTDLALSGASLLENEPVGTVVGSFSAVDADPGDVFTYALVAGPGDADNALFSISGGDLLAEASFNCEVQSNYSIRVEVMDQGGLSTQKAFTVGVLDVVEPPPAFAGHPEFTSDGVVIQWESLANHRYTILVSTDLVAGFTVLASNMSAAPGINAYTGQVSSAAYAFWQIATDP